MENSAMAWFEDILEIWQLFFSSPQKHSVLTEHDYTKRRISDLWYLSDWLAESESHFLGYIIVNFLPINNLNTIVS